MLFFLSFFFLNNFPRQLLAQIWDSSLISELFYLAQLACECMLREAVNTAVLREEQRYKVLTDFKNNAWENRVQLDLLFISFIL